MRKSFKLVLLIITLCFTLASVNVVGIFKALELQEKSGNNLTLSSEKAWAKFYEELNKPEEKVIDNATLANKFDPSVILLSLTKKASVSLKNYTVEDFPEIECESVKDSSSSTTKKVQESLQKGEIPQIYHRLLTIKLKIPSKQAVLDAIDLLITREDVYGAGINGYVIRPASIGDNGFDSDVVTNDNSGNLQWGLECINVSKCWNFTMGSPEILVGVVDSGIKSDHEDLIGRVDSDLSVDFTKDDYNNPNNDDDSGAFVDANGHATHISGIIGANANNSEGITGVSSGIKLASLKIYNQTGYSEQAIENLIDAIEYATVSEIPILNLSLATDRMLDYELSRLYDALSRYPGIAVCAAGNNNTNNIEYPAGYDLDNVISVGAIEMSEQIYTRWAEELVQGGGFNQDFPVGGRPVGSNYGEWVDIFAPGHNVYSTWKNGAYCYQSGTSMATPFVVGVVAMLKSINPELTNTQIKSAILNTADDFYYIAPDDLNEGATRSFASKKINALEALKQVMNLYSDTLVLQYTNKSYAKEINSSKTIYNEKKAMVKLIVNEEYNYSFSTSSTSALNVKLYDSNLNELTVNKTITNNGASVNFNANLNVGTYYVETEYQNANTQGEVTINVTVPPHAHSYEDRYKWYDSLKHKSICVCNQYVLSPHVVLQENRERCVLCLGLVGGNGFGGIIHSVTKTHVTQNGSYILPNGIIVLNELDVKAYFNGTLTFIQYNGDIV